MKYPIVFFDLDDTLFDFKKGAKLSLLNTLRTFKLPTEQAYLDLYKQINHEVWQSFEKREISAEQLRPLRFERFLDAIKEVRDPIEMSGFFLNKLSNSDYLLEGAKPLVEGLIEKGHRLALVTNGLKEVQRPRISKAAMGGYFETIVVSDEIGIAKPHEGFFDHAFSEMGKPEKQEVLMVGDSLSSDIQGGNKYGISTCWFNPYESTNNGPHQPKYQISKLKNLMEIV